MTMRESPRELLSFSPNSRIERVLTIARQPELPNGLKPLAFRLRQGAFLRVPQPNSPSSQQKWPESCVAPSRINVARLSQIEEMLCIVIKLRAFLHGLFKASWQFIATQPLAVVSFLTGVFVQNFEQTSVSTRNRDVLMRSSHHYLCLRLSPSATNAA
jgi:hypothetical protein